MGVQGESMQVKLPAVWALNEKASGIGFIRQLLLPARAIECRLVPYKQDRDNGYTLLDEENRALGFLFPSKLKSASFSPTDRVVLAKCDSTEAEIIDLSSGSWLQHPLLQGIPKAASLLASAARESWRGAFRFVEENTDNGIIGLRRPQVGALHAIHAHWATSTETATVVMPTGTGKTDTMLSILTSALCERILVVVPTDALRTQIAEKFETLGVLKADGNAVLSHEAQCPVVGTLLALPTTSTDVRSFFSHCNVVVTTSALIGGCAAEVQEEMAELCSHLFIDEAHHSEAKTWKSFRQLFEKKLVVQFTATPFREDGQKIDGKLVFVYPLRKAQEEGYFRPIRFRQVQEFVPRYWRPQNCGSGA